MDKKCEARKKLEQARLFVSRAYQVKPDQREILVGNLEAAIVFGRSVTFCLHKDFHDKPGFDVWYAKKQDLMRQDPLFKYFVEKRNYVLKEGSAGIYKSINMEIALTIGISDFVTSCKVIRGRPWYRRSPKILWQDYKASIREPIRQWMWKRNMRNRAKRKRAHSTVKVSEGYYFDDPAWESREIFDLFGEYLDKLEQIVSEAEKTFS